MTTWNLQPATAGAATGAGREAKEIRLPEAAAVLKTLDPDVILLQQVRDWKMCAGLAQALRPANYSVLLCSAFREARTGGAGSQQVAILAKQPAYFCWSQPWGDGNETASPGGFAFAAIEVRGQRVGFYSVEPGGKSAFVPQLLAQVASVRAWVTNRVQVFVVGATLDTGSADWAAAEPDTVRRLQGAGFADVFLEAPASQRITLPRKAGQPGAAADCIFTQPPGCGINPRILSSAVAEHYPVTCDLELDPARIAAAWTAHSEAMASKEPVPATGLNHVAKPETAAAEGVSQPAGINSRLIAALALGGILALIAVVWVLARRTRSGVPAERRQLRDPQAAALCRDAATSYTVVVGTQSATAPASHAAGATSTPRPVMHLGAPSSTQTQAEMLRQRALAAEARAERATAVLRNGLLPHLSQWLKQKLVRRLIADRTELMETQQEATRKAMTMEARLARVELQIQHQNRGYQERIEALTRELIAAKEENRDLIRAQIRQVKAEMEAARARLMAQAEGDDRG